MSTLINLPVLCASISLPKRLKSGKKSAEIKEWDSELAGDGHVRDAKWSETIAVGSRSFVEKILEKLGVKVSGRKAVEAGDGYELKEDRAPYGSDFEGEMAALRHKNSYPWRVYSGNSTP